MSSTVVDSRLVSWLTGLPVGADRPPRPVVRPIDAPFFRTTIGPLLLLTTTPFLVLGVWEAVVHHQGSLLALAFAGPAAWVADLPVPTVTALAIVAGWFVFQALLLRLLPGPTFPGPVTPEGERPIYKLNGIAAWVVTHGLLFGIAWPLGWLDPARLYDHFGAILVILNLGALAFCVFLYAKGRLWPTGRDTVVTGNPVFDIFQGPELHPRLFGTNLKQLINCRVSMMGWSAIVIAFAIASAERHGFSWGTAASAFVLVAYLFKFFWWEDGYFQSIDIIHDRFGYYIAWGVLVWVPSIYCLFALYQVEVPSTLSMPAALAVALLGLVAIWVNYDADAQRQRVRATNGETKVWGRPPVIVRARWVAGDGQERDSILLASGWWGVARHFHYVPELAAAFFWTVPAGFAHFTPWFYWVFLLILLTDRARRDEKKCAAKYGDFWAQYTAKVRWRMVPGIY